jgi:hypothetical protein
MNKVDSRIQVQHQARILRMRRSHLKELKHAGSSPRLPVVVREQQSGRTVQDIYRWVEARHNAGEKARAEGADGDI